MCRLLRDHHGDARNEGMGRRGEDRARRGAGTRRGVLGRRFLSWSPADAAGHYVEACRELKFKDPSSVCCPACGCTSVQSVNDLLARRAKCSRCGHLLAETSEWMNRMLD